MQIRQLLPAVLALALLAGCGSSDRDPSDLIVISCSPHAGQTNVPASSIITLRFSEPVDHRTVVGTNQIILADQSNAIVPVSFSFSGEVVTLTPGSPLSPNATYGLAVRPGVRDVYGQNIETPFEARFSTGYLVASIPNWPPFTVSQTGGPIAGGPPGTWTVATPMNNARAWHTINRLQDGRILVTGGEQTVGFSYCTHTAELFDPTVLTWTQSQSNGGRGMYYDRAGHTATLLQNGKVLVAGGTPNGKEILDTAEVYDPLTDIFSIVKSAMMQKRVFHTATLIGNGNVVLIGGVVPVNNPLTIMTDTIEVFDVNSGTFNQSAVSLLPQNVFIRQPGQPLVPSQLPLGRHLHTATVLPDQSILVCGGYTPPDITVPFTTTNAQFYMPDTSGIGIMGTIQQTAGQMMTSRALHTATLIPTGEASGLVYIFGGFSNNPYTGACASGEVFDYTALAHSGPNTGQPGTFTALAAHMNVDRRSHTATYINSGMVYDNAKQSTYTASDGLILLVGGARYAGLQTTNTLTPPYPDLWVEPVGCACTATPTTELFDPFSFGKNPALPFRGTDQSGACFWTADAQGNQTFLPQAGVGLFNHRSIAFPSTGQVLVTGGMDCGFCIPQPFEGVILANCAIYNP